MSVAAWLLGTAIASVCSLAGAAYPEKPVRFVVPTTQGGGADTLARHIATRLSDRWGQQVVVDNRPGANGITGVEAVAKAAPDGYTLLMTFTDHFVNPSLYKTLPFSMEKDFAPVVFVGSLPFVLAVHPSVPANSVQELIALARSKPGKLNFGSAGTGGSVHLAGELFKSMAGVDITHVPYKGTSAAMPDLVSGRIEMMFPSAITAKPFADNGRLRLLRGHQRKAFARRAATADRRGIGHPGLRSRHLVRRARSRRDSGRYREEIERGHP